MISRSGPNESQPPTIRSQPDTVCHTEPQRRPPGWYARARHLANTVVFGAWRHPARQTTHVISSVRGSPRMRRTRAVPIGLGVRIYGKTPAHARRFVGTGKGSLGQRMTYHAKLLRGLNNMRLGKCSRVCAESTAVTTNVSSSYRVVGVAWILCRAGEHPAINPPESCCVRESRSARSL